MYNAIYKPNQLIYGSPESPVVIVCGWTRKEAVSNRLNPNEYAAIGQLYSASRGINFLIRNLLANPQIRIVVGLGCTDADRASGSMRALENFFSKGFSKGYSDTGKECWVIRGGVKGYIDLEIPGDVLIHLSEKVGYFPASSIESVKGLAQGFLTNYPQLEPWGEPLSYPMVLRGSTTKPSTLYGHRIEGATVAECWPKILHRIRTNGDLRPTGYDGQIQELLDMVVVCHEPVDLYFPDPNYLPMSRTFLEGAYLSQVLDDAQETPGVKYTYGQRMRSWFGRDQIADVVAKLQKEIDSASAVISLWDAQHDNIRSGSPCLNHIWFRVLGDQLSMTATLRSNDMFSAWPANAMALRKLQDLIRQQVDPNLELGPLVTISQSAHIYDDSFEAADKVVHDHYSGGVVTRVSYDDPVGNFIIERSSEGIQVQHTTPAGELIHLYKGMPPLRVLRSIVADNPTILPDHAAYLGLEIGRASVKSVPYEQDR